MIPTNPAYLPLGLHPKNGKPLSVMVVDDSKTIRLFLKQILLSENFEILIEAEDGEDAVNKLKTAAVKPDIYFSDIEMPKLNGIEALKQVKPLIPDAKLVLVTSVKDEQKIKEAIQLGISGYIVKGEGSAFNRKEFLERLASILKRNDYLARAL